MICQNLKFLKSQKYSNLYSFITNELFLVQEKLETVTEKLQQKEDESSRQNSIVTFCDSSPGQGLSTQQQPTSNYLSNITSVESPALTSSSSTGLAVGLSSKQRSQLPPQPHLSQQLKTPKSKSINFTYHVALYDVYVPSGYRI